MNDDLALLLAWPETYCKQPGSWYDPLMDKLGVSVNGYYRVGHSAIVLIRRETGSCHYFDFGRYQTPTNLGRVRDKSTDKNLTINTRIKFTTDGCPLNIDDLHHELSTMKDCNGEGRLEAGLININFKKSYSYAKKVQKQKFVPYGPFVINGTNCSRFTRSTALKGMTFSGPKIRMTFPLMLTPTPYWNVSVTDKISGKSDVETAKAIHFKSNFTLSNNQL